jgi:hypothetical protein
MRQVWGAMTNSVVIVWALVLYCCFRDVRFPAALFVAVIGLALIVLLLKRVGRKLARAIMTLAVIGLAVASIADPAFRQWLATFLDDVLVFDCPRAIVWATVYTICYAVLRLTRPAAQRPA